MNSIDLIIIKKGDMYIRFKGNDYLTCKLDKASVFPLDQIDMVKTHLIKLKQKGFEQVSVRKLTLVEKPFDIENYGGKSE